MSKDGIQIQKVELSRFVLPTLNKLIFKKDELTFGYFYCHLQFLIKPRFYFILSSYNLNFSVNSEGSL